MRNLTWGLILILIGIGILLDNLEYADFWSLVRDYWPVLLIIWGASILIRRNSRVATPPPAQATTAPPQPPPPPPPPSTPPTGDDLIHQSNVFGDVYSHISSQTFKGGSISTVFGSCTIDLTSATLAPGDHELRLHGVFGDTTIIVPKEMAVSVSATTLLGDVTTFGQKKGGFSTDIQTASQSFASSTNRLKIIAHRVFGSVHVY